MASPRRRGRRRLRGGWGRLLLWWGCRGLRCGCLGLWCGCLRLWCGCLRLWCGWLLLWWGWHRFPWCGQRLFCLRRRCLDRRRDRLYRRRRDLWRLRRNNLPHGGRPDQCGEHRAVCARLRPLRSQPRRRWQLSRTHHARDGGYQGCDHRRLGTHSPTTHSRCRRCGHTPTWPSRRASNLAVCAKARW